MPRPGAYPGGDTATQQQAAYPDLQPLSLDLAPERAFALARTLVEDRGWAIVAAEPGEGHIEAVATTLLYGFEDEVVIRVAPTETGRSEEHTSELQSLMRNSYAVFCLKKKKNHSKTTT